MKGPTPPDNCYKLSESDPNGNGTSYTYDSLGNVLTATKAAPSGTTVDSTKGSQVTSATTTYTYESRFNQVLTVTDAGSNVTTYDYGTALSNPGGNLLSITSPTTAAGTAVESYTYNSLGQVLTDTAPDGTVTKNVYDSGTGYLTERIRDYSAGSGHLNATTQYTYDSYGHVASVTDPNGNVTTTTTNALNQVTEIDGPNGEVETRGYDAAGNLVTDQKTAPGSTVEKTVNLYDTCEELIATRAYTGTSTYLETDYTYDGDGNRLTVTDPLGHTVTTAYDERDKPYLFTDALSHTVKYDFDGNGNTVKLTDELSHATTYAYDGLDKLEEKTFPDSSYQTWKYDADGNITGLRTTAGNSISQTYDTRNRMLTQTYPLTSGTSTITNTYDLVGRVLTTTEGGTSLTYTYDALGRNLTFTDQAGHESTYTYDLDGHRLTSAYPSSITVKRFYDSSNRLQYLKDGSNVTQATFSYDILDRVTGVSLANSTSVAYGYDLLNRLGSVDNTLASSVTRNYSYVYDNASRVTSITEPRGTIASGYTYRNEVNSITEPSGSPFSDQSFAYDYGYNRATWVLGGTTTSYTANNLNQYTAVGGCHADLEQRWRFGYVLREHLHLRCANAADRSRHLPWQVPLHLRSAWTAREESRRKHQRHRARHLFVPLRRQRSSGGIPAFDHVDLLSGSWHRPGRHAHRWHEQAMVLPRRPRQRFGGSGQFGCRLGILRVQRARPVPNPQRQFHRHYQFRHRHCE